MQQRVLEDHGGRRPTNPEGQSQQAHVTQTPNRVRRPVTNEVDKSDTEPGWLTLSAGYASTQRTFSYVSADPNNDGIQYQAAFVPGFVIDAAIVPFVSQSGFLSRLSLGVLYEKIFLRSLFDNERTTGEIEKALVETTHDRIRAQIRYTHRLDSGMEFFATVGGGQLRFLHMDNDPYRGVVYRYMELTAGMHLPLNGPAIALEAEAGGMPLVSLGDFVTELGQRDATRGSRGFLGLSSRIKLGEQRPGRHHRTLMMRLGMNYTWFISGLAGPGRDGRVGQSAEDRYLGIRATVGLRF